jgi:type IV pilus assembly protein PilC
MPAFKYVARDATTGQEILNSISAESEQAAIVALLNRNQLVVAIEEKESNKTRRTEGGKITLKDLVSFTRQLATMVEAGMAIVGCLKSLARQSRSKLMSDVIRDVCVSVESGESFTDALAKHPKVFDNLYICLVGAGEKSGMLADSLSRIATHLEGSERLRRKVKSAMMYPTVVLLVAFVVTVFLLVKVVPVFGEIYDSFRGQLPAPTRALIAFSNFVQHWFFLMAIVAVAGIIGWIRFLKTKAGREFWDSRRIKLPIFGQIAHQICLARLTRTFGALVKSGVPILSVLQTVSKACGNVVMEKAINACTVEIQLGSGISEAMAKRPIFTEMVVDMISAGEQTGKLDEMLNRVADHLDEEIETTLAGLTTLIEPIIIVVLGVVIGTIVICMFLPIFKLSDLVSGRH